MSCIKKTHGFMNKKRDASTVINWYLFSLFIIYPIVCLFSFFSGVAYPKSVELFGGATMKFTVTYMFLLVGITMFINGRVRLALSVVILTTCIYILTAFYYAGNIMFLPSFDGDWKNHSAIHDMPSLGTLLAFLVYSISRIFYFKKDYYILFFISICVLAGYLMNISIMTFYFQGVSSAMAVPSTVLILHLAFYSRQKFNIEAK